MGHVLDYALPALAAVVATATGNPELAPYAAAGTSGATNYAEHGNPLQALGAAGGSFIGGNLGNSFLGSQLGTVGGAFDSALGSGASSDIASALGGGALGGVAGTSVGRVLGSVAGNKIGAGMFPDKPQAPSPYIPVRAGSMGLPTSLNSMSSLTPQQQASGLATQGMYGGGIGSQEKGYFGNLVNRQLVNDNNQVSSTSTLPPIETSFLNKQGFDTSNPNSLLEALSKWNPSS